MTDLVEFSAVDVEVEAIRDYLTVLSDEVGDNAGSGCHLSGQRHREQLVLRVHLQCVTDQDVTRGDDL